MSGELLKDAIMKKLDEGIKKIENGKTMEGLDDIRKVLGSSWLLDRNPDALMVDIALFSLESRIEKLKDNKEFKTKWVKTLRNLAEAFQSKDTSSIYTNLKEMVSCTMQHVPRVEG